MAVKSSREASQSGSTQSPAKICCAKGPTNDIRVTLSEHCGPLYQQKQEHTPGLTLAPDSGDPLTS